jgi:hypothetical protein
MDGIELPQKNNVTSPSSYASAGRSESVAVTEPAPLPLSAESFHGQLLAWQLVVVRSPELIVGATATVSDAWGCERPGRLLRTAWFIP